MSKKHPDGKRQLWHDQCAAARGLISKIGWETTVEYLVGEKFVSFITNDLEHCPELNEDLPKFIREIKDMFSQEELRDYLMNVKSLGPLERSLYQDLYEEMSGAAVSEDGPVSWANDILIIERLKELLLD